MKPETDSKKLPEKTYSGGIARKWLPSSLSGKVLLLTILFVMIAEILIFVPSVANFRLTWLRQHLQLAESVTQIFQRASINQNSVVEQNELLQATDALAVVMRHEGASRILAMNSMPVSVDQQSHIYPVEQTRPLESIVDAFDTLLFGGERAIRVFKDLEQSNGMIEIVMMDSNLRQAMLTYARNVMLISLVISLFTAVLVFLSLRWLLIRPMQNMSTNMLSFSQKPEDPNRIIEPRNSTDELGLAEQQLADMQRRLQQMLKEQKNLADLGLAVSKINHDLRNILASAQLFSDRLSSLPDPTVQRLSPKLIRTIDRAVDYTKAVLAYGKASEATPDKKLLSVFKLVEDVADILNVDQNIDLTWVNSVSPDVELYADSEQIFRVLVNICRNALQAMDQISDEYHVQRLEISSYQQSGMTVISISDTGPGVPEKAREKLFQAFQGSTRPGGTGLGLAIAAEIVRAHDGVLSLAPADPPGSTFLISLPDHQSATRPVPQLKIVG